jgi:hypothetical protein
MDEARARRRGRTISIVLLALAASGCASHRGPGRRGDTMRPPSFAHPTVGADRRTIPRGRTIPPSGLGVDLVRLPAGGAPPTTTPPTPRAVPIDDEARPVVLLPD